MSAKSNSLIFLLLQMDVNPWQVESLQDFLYLKCPECTYDTKEDLSFQDHALQNHPLSSVFFGKTFVKEENYYLEEDYLEDYKDPLTTSSENIALLPIFPKLSNIKEELIDDTSEFKEEIEKHVNPKRPKPHGCSKCDKSFTTPKRLKKHFEIVHEGKKPKTKENIKQEVNEGSESNVRIGKNSNPKRPKPHICLKCNRGFSAPKRLQQHVAMVHEGAKISLECDICKTTFANKSGLTHHIKSVHEKIRPHKCPECDFDASVKQHLTRHLLRIHGISLEKNEHLCSDCGYQTLSKGELEEHIDRVHKGLKPYMCSNCGKDFSTKIHLKRHMKRHAGTKNYQCTFCDYKSVESSVIKKHIRAVHEKERPYVCPICNKCFGQTSHLKTHISGVHEGKQPIKSMKKRNLEPAN